MTNCSNKIEKIFVNLYKYRKCRQYIEHKKLSYFDYIWPFELQNTLISKTQGYN